MFETIDDITMTYEEEEIVLVKELAKEVLTRGAWTTIIFKFQEWNKKNEEYGKEKYSIRRYQKRNGEFSQKSKFNISNTEQAKKVIETLQKMINE